MAFFKLRSQGNEARGTSAAAAPAESVESMRRRARHRLLGAAVLVLLGVIGFPLLFDTQPRPVAVDIPIEIPDRNKVKPLPPPSAAAPPPAAATGSVPPERMAAAPAGGRVITETPDGREVTAADVPAAAPRAEPPRTETRPESRPETRPAEPRPESRPAARPQPQPEARPEARPEPRAATTRPAEDGARARALLEGRSNTPPAAGDDDKGRFVVQVGAFADTDKARETRQKLEKAGLKTYVHVAKTPEGERTRVRVGPFGSRAEADKAAARIKGLALPAAVLSL